MSILKDIFFMEAEAKIAESINNEIQLENFELQAKKQNILELKPTPCKSKFWGFIEYTVDHNYLTFCYADLFNYLVKKEIIISKIDYGTFFTANFVYTLPQPFIDQKEFQKRINPTNSDYPEILKCYTIHENKLYDLLKNYKHDVTDEYVRKVQLLGEFPTKNPKSISKQSKRSIRKGGKGVNRKGRKKKTKNKQN
jgi:hypothetical protein